MKEEIRVWKIPAQSGMPWQVGNIHVMLSSRKPALDSGRVLDEGGEGTQVS